MGKVLLASVYLGIWVHLDTIKIRRLHLKKTQRITIFFFVFHTASSKLGKPSGNVIGTFLLTWNYVHAHRALALRLYWILAPLSSCSENPQDV